CPHVYTQIKAWKIKMMAIPSFKPYLSYKQLNRTLSRLLAGSIPEQAGGATFEREFARYLGVKHAIRVPSARWGLYYILKGLNLKEGDEVILPAFNYFAVPAAILKLGLRPVFVDIAAGNMNIDTEKIKENITQRTRAVIATHLCGFVCVLDEILDICRKYNITVIEDCVQSLGAEYKGKKAGSWGHFSYFSFGVTKHFTTLGAGMVTTSDDKMADIIRSSIDAIRPVSRKALLFELVKGYIMKFATSPVMFPAAHCFMKAFSFFDVDIVDYIFREKEILPAAQPKNGRLNNIQAELGIEQLSCLDRENELRMKNGMELYNGLNGIPNIRIPILESSAKNIFSSCPVFVKDKRNMRRKLLAKGIDASAGYMKDCSGLGIFSSSMKYCTNASKAEEEVLYLPLYAELGHREIRYIKEKIREICR
ncbi:MAG: aminotransferase class V-fold PLP-dependent enzyme, partial [Candidatus Omnitrophica bacterium]|nr:aminotransferase class V-fold PLP-dependent enzyme [Candidatus Omnitrophota bacterium]